MKKLLLLPAFLLLVHSCTPTQQGAYVGAVSGGMMGGALGGIMGGHRGHDVGHILGSMAGAVVGATVASENERRNSMAYEEGYSDGYNRGRNSSSRRYNQRSYSSRRNIDQSYSSQSSRSDGGQTSRFGTIRGSVSSSDASTNTVAASPFVLRNLRFVDEGKNQIINSNESGQIIFELTNTSDSTLLDVVPFVCEVSGNEHINMSPSTRIASVKSGETVRYTCHLKTDGKINVGTLTFRISVSSADTDFYTLREFSLPTGK